MKKANRIQAKTEDTNILDILALKKEVVELTIKEYEIGKLIKHCENFYSKEELEKITSYKAKLGELKEATEILVEDITFWEERFY